MGAHDTPVFSGLIADLYAQRSAADERADVSARLLADLELLHEPDAGGDCPTCGVAGPCLTFRMLRREVTVDEAVAAVREHRVIDLTAAGPTPSVPSLKELLAVAPHGVDKFFEALLGLPSAEKHKAS